MKRAPIILTFFLLFAVFGCSKTTCTCVDIFGGEQQVELTAFETCSDLEPMMGNCTEN